MLFKGDNDGMKMIFVNANEALLNVMNWTLMILKYSSWKQLLMNLIPPIPKNDDEVGGF